MVRPLSNDQRRRAIAAVAKRESCRLGGVAVWEGGVVGGEVVAALSGDRLRGARQDGRAPEVALERARSDIARRRQRWHSWQAKLDPRRLVFIDETWIKTNMAPLRGWGPKGERCGASRHTATGGR
jgi:hypothetical protein